MTLSAAEGFTPVFDWNAPRSRKFALFIFISGSAALHALCFYVFQVIYPPIVALPPPPARVSVITPVSEEGRLLLRWIEAEDPALSSTTQRPPEAGLSLPSPEHVPSYVNRKPALREPAPYQPDHRVPSSSPPAPVPVSRSAPSAPVVPLPTELKFGTETNRFGAPAIPPLRFAPSSKEPPQSAKFRVAIGRRGDVRYCFLENSSGDSGLDEQARHYLLLCRFSPSASDDAKAENDFLWTTATFEWGNDLAASSTAASPRP